MVYVDKITSYQSFQISPQAKKYGSRWCHLFADTVEELHEFAEKLSLRREWFQNKKIFPHYDIVFSKRRQAILLGAKEVDLREFIKGKMLKSC